MLNKLTIWEGGMPIKTTFVIKGTLIEYDKDNPNHKDLPCQSVESGELQKSNSKDSHAYEKLKTKNNSTEYRGGDVKRVNEIEGISRSVLTPDESITSISSLGQVSSSSSSDKKVPPSNLMGKMDDEYVDNMSELSFQGDVLEGVARTSKNDIALIPEGESKGNRGNQKKLTVREKDEKAIEKLIEMGQKDLANKFSDTIKERDATRKKKSIDPDSFKSDSSFAYSYKRQR